MANSKDKANKPARQKKPEVIVRSFDIDTKKKYLLILPKYVYNHPQLGPAIFKLFEGVMYVSVVMDRPQDIKIISVENVDSQAKPDQAKKA